MADVFREVDEDLRREQLKKLWDRFAPYVIGLAVLIVVAVSGYKLWEWWQIHQAETSGDRFIAALDLSDAGKRADSIKALQAVAGEASGAYPVLARFRIASEKADDGDKTGAVADFDAIAARTDVPVDVRNMARLRAALILVDTASQSDINMRVGDLATVGSPWRHNAREILALAAWRAGDYANAKTYFDQVNADQEAPQDMRDRATVMLSLIAGKNPTTASTPAAGLPATGAPPPPATAVPPQKPEG
jgi:hypothetical protein